MSFCPLISHGKLAVTTAGERARAAGARAWEHQFSQDFNSFQLLRTIGSRLVSI